MTIAVELFTVNSSKFVLFCVNTIAFQKAGRMAFSIAFAISTVENATVQNECLAMKSCKFLTKSSVIESLNTRYQSNVNQPLLLTQ